MGSKVIFLIGRKDNPKIVDGKLERQVGGGSFHSEVYIATCQRNEG